MSLVDVESYYQSMPVDEIWGVGRKYAKKLNDMGILTVLDLATSNPNRMRELFNVNMQSTILELLGQSCFEFESSPKAK
ncbi:Y-family DNA polymerase, partial [Glaesserella parasuis]